MTRYNIDQHAHPDGRPPSMTIKVNRQELITQYVFSGVFTPRAYGSNLPGWLVRRGFASSYNTEYPTAVCFSTFENNHHRPDGLPF